MLLLAELVVQQGDDGLARELCGKMGLGRVPIMIGLGIHLARQLDADTATGLDLAGLEQDSPEEANADRRAELARRGWTSWRSFGNTPSVPLRAGCWLVVVNDLC